MARLKYFAQEHDTVTRYVNLLTQTIWELRKLQVKICECLNAKFTP